MHNYVFIDIFSLYQQDLANRSEKTVIRVYGIAEHGKGEVWAKSL